MDIRVTQFILIRIYNTCYLSHVIGNNLLLLRVRCVGQSQLVIWAAAEVAYEAVEEVEYQEEKEELDEAWVAK